MTAEEAFGGGIFIVDKSALLRARHPDVREEWTRAARNDQLRKCAITLLEILYSARDAAQVAEAEAVWAVVRDVPVTATACNAAVVAMGTLGAHSDGYHRISTPDYLIAAVAQDASVGVLHYDQHFYRLREVFEFESRWIVPRGSSS